MATSGSPPEPEVQDLRRRVAALEVAIAQMRQWIQEIDAKLAESGPDADSVAPQDALSAGGRATSSQGDRRLQTPRPPEIDLETDLNVLGEDLSLPKPESVAQGSAVPVDAGQNSLAGLWLNQGEFWLNRLGIGLLLLGVGFLFKYSIDQGWITPGVRVGFGLALGGLLLATGLRIRASHQPLSQVLQGGSIATFYITGFAAYQLYNLLAYPIAFIGMVGVTLLAFFLSLRQQNAVLSVIGVLGGLGTPFLLYRGEGSLTGLVIYTGLVLLGASAIYWQQGWRSLIWTTFSGVWLIFLIGYGTHLSDLAHGVSPPAWSDGLRPAIGHRGVLQGGVALALLAFWPLPIARTLLQLQVPQGLTAPVTLPAPAGMPLRLDPAVPLSVLTPLLGLFFTCGIWQLRGNAPGWLAIALAASCGLLGGYLRQKHRPELANTQVLSGFLLFILALAVLLEGNLTLLSLAATAALIHWSARKLSALNLAIAAHLLAAAIGIWLLERLLTDGVRGTALLNLAGLTDLGVIAIALGISRLLRAGTAVLIYQGFSHLALLFWFWRELAGLPNGSAYITIAWGIYGVLLLVLGLRRDRHPLRLTGMATLLLVVIKLLIVDLARLEAIWRILLFLGFGGLFLILSYSLRSLWQPGQPLAPKPTKSGKSSPPQPPV